MIYIFALLQVTAILRVNEFTQEFQGYSVKSYDSNQLPSNNPIEDTRAEARCLLTQGDDTKGDFDIL
jgi:pyruvate dehydrogenase phosphatase